MESIKNVGFDLFCHGLAMLLSGCGTAASRVYHIGVLSGLCVFSPAFDGFKAKMTELGYVEGENVVYDVQSTEVDIDAYKQITQINNVRESGGNITGVRFPSVDLTVIRLQTLVEIVPNAKEKQFIVFNSRVATLSSVLPAQII
jgi:putative tryptophan/tyrosine transport system substrate-binding protein